MSHISSKRSSVKEKKKEVDESDDESKIIEFIKKSSSKDNKNKKRSTAVKKVQAPVKPVVVADPDVNRSAFEKIVDLPSYVDISDALQAFIDKVKGVEEIDVFTNRDVFALATKAMPFLVKLCNALKIASAPISIDVPTATRPVVVPQIPENLIPPGIQMIRNSLSELKDMIDKNNIKLKEPQRRFAEPMDQSVRRLLDPYQIIRNPRLAEPVPTVLHPLLVHTRKDQAKTIKADALLFVSFLKQSDAFKETLTEFCKYLLQYCTALQKPEIHLAVAAEELFGRKRNPVLISLYCTYIYASAIRSLYYGAFSQLPPAPIPVTPAPIQEPASSSSSAPVQPVLKKYKKMPLKVAKEVVKVTPAAETPAAQVVMNLPFTEEEPVEDPRERAYKDEEERNEWWKKIGCYDIYKATLGGDNSLGQCIPTNSIHFIRKGIKEIACFIDYNDKSWKDVVHKFCGMVARSLMVEGTVLPKDLFHDTIVRLCFFHLQVMRCYEFMYTRSVVKAIPVHGFCHYSKKTPLIELLIKLHPKIELDPKSKRHFMALASGIVRCPGEGYFEHERSPWHQPDPVKVRDNASVGERPLALKLESTSFSKMLVNPELIVEGIPENERDPRTVKALACLAFMFLLDYHLTARTYDEETGKLERFLQNYIAVYPQPIKEKCMGTVIIVGRQFFVYSWDGLIDVNNNPALLISVMMSVLRQASPDYSQQAQNITAELQSMSDSLKSFGDEPLEIQFNIE